MSNTPGKEILFSWQILFEGGVIGKNFPYPPDSEDTDSVPTPDFVNKLQEERTPKEEPEEEKVNPFPTSCTLTQGEAVHSTGDSLSWGPVGKSWMLTNLPYLILRR